MEWLKLWVVAGSFATLVTVHVALLWGLSRWASRQKLLASLLLPPLAPYFGWSSGTRVRASIWLGSLLVYLIASLAGGVYLR